MKNDDYIKRSDALNELYRYASEKDPLHTIKYRVDVCERIEKIPAANVKSGIQGYWIDENPESFLDPRMRCSICGHIDLPLAKWRFCPVCGANMKSEFIENK